MGLGRLGRSLLLLFVLLQSIEKGLLFVSGIIGFSSGGSRRLLGLFNSRSGSWSFFSAANFLLMLFFMGSKDLLLDFGALNLRDLIQVLPQFCLDFFIYLFLLGLLRLQGSFEGLLLLRDEESDATLLD